MIRTPEITYFVFDEIEKWLSKDDYKEIEIVEDGIYILIQAKKSIDDYLFDVGIKYNDTTKNVKTIVNSLTPVLKEKRMFCLKLLNYVSFYDEEQKYILCPFKYRISCLTVFSILESSCSIGDDIAFSATWSIINIANIHQAIKYDDVRTCELNPIRFHNYL